MSDGGSTVGAAGSGLFGMLGAFETLQAEQDQINAMRANANFYDTQAGYNQKASDREQEIFKHEVDDLLGRQVSAYGKSGVDLSGSPMMLIGQTKERAAVELNAIKEKGRQNVELSLMRAKSAQEGADELSDASFDHFGMNLFKNVLMVGNAGGAAEMDRRKAKAEDQSKESHDEYYRSTGAGTAVHGGNIPQDYGYKGGK